MTKLVIRESKARVSRPARAEQKLSGPARTHRRAGRKREYRLSREENAVDAIGEIRRGDDMTIITFGQFSMIDALVAILRQTGPADVTVSSWTAEDYDLERSAHLLEEGSIRRIRFLLDRSFRARRKALYRKHLKRVFGADGIRGVRNHAKLLLVRSDTHDVVVRASMNLNTNPNMENLDISEDPGLADFIQEIVDSIWEEVGPDEDRSALPAIERLPDQIDVTEVRAGVIKRGRLREARSTHVVRGATR